MCLTTFGTYTVLHRIIHRFRVCVCVLCAIHNNKNIISSTNTCVLCKSACECVDWWPSVENTESAWNVWMCVRLGFRIPHSVLRTCLLFRHYITLHGRYVPNAAHSAFIMYSPWIHNNSIYKTEPPNKLTYLNKIELNAVVVAPAQAPHNSSNVPFSSFTAYTICMCVSICARMCVCVCALKTQGANEEKTKGIREQHKQKIVCIVFDVGGGLLRTLTNWVRFREKFATSSWLPIS